MRSEVELPINIKRYGYEIDDLGYCHHCKQIKRIIVHAKCNYNSICVPEGGHVFHPVAVHVDKVKLYNVDQNSETVNDQLILKKLVNDKKRRRLLEQQLPVICDKHFCSLCLKNFFDVDLDEVKNNPNWVCPYCSG